MYMVPNISAESKVWGARTILEFLAPIGEQFGEIPGPCLSP